MRGQPYRFVDFRGGLNTKAADYLVGENECRECNNVVSTVRGSIKKRNGNTTFCSTFTGLSAGVQSLFAMETAATVLIATGGTKIFSVSTGGVSTDITGAASLTSGKKWAFVTAPASGGQGPLYGMNGTDTPKQWIGSGNIADWTATVGSVPNGTIMAFTQNKIFTAGMAANPSRLQWCDIGNPRSWTATNVVDLDPNDGQVITGIAPLGPYLFVFKQKKIFVIYDLTTGANRSLSNAVGCVAPRSIAESNHGLFFLSADEGVMLATPNKVDSVSDNVRTTFERFDPTERSEACGAFWKDHYYISAASFLSPRCDMTLDYDTTTNSWWKHSNFASQFALWRPSASGEVQLYAAQDNTVPIIDKCYVENTFQDNGAAMPISWTGPWLTYKQPYLRKRLRQIHVDGRGPVDLYIGRDFFTNTELIYPSLFGDQVLPSGTNFGGTGTMGVEGIFGDPVFRGEGRSFTQGVNRAFCVQFKNTSSLDVEIDAYITAIQFRKS